MLLERYGKLTMWKSKSSRLSYSLVESLPPLSMIDLICSVVPITMLLKKNVALIQGWCQLKDLQHI